MLLNRHTVMGTASKINRISTFYKSPKLLSGSSKDNPKIAETFTSLNTSVDPEFNQKSMLLKKRMS